MRRAQTAILLCLLVPTSALSAQIADEEAVWKLEEAYWEYVKCSDLEAYRQLWADDFVGWPSFSSTPVGTESITGWIVPLHENPGEVFDYDLSREAVRSFGDVVVAHYLVRILYRSAETGEVVRRQPSVRITHTWQLQDDAWKIITGMSAEWIGDDEKD
jgi:ketosteroid isomerase-like protein